MNKKCALISGASSGIGEACAEILANQGYNLILVARRIDRIQALGIELQAKYAVEIKTFKVDVREKEDIQSMLNQLNGKWRKIDVLINNAGLALGLSPIESGEFEHWDTMIDTNIKGLLYMTRLIVPLMIESGKGHIVNVGSIAGKEIYANGNVYCATKHAVDALNRSMRLDLSKYPIRVSAVHPGAVETEFSLVRFEGNKDKAASVYTGFENLIAKDVAEAVWFMINRPIHVNINELTIMPTAQPMASVIQRKPVK